MNCGRCGVKFSVQRAQVGKRRYCSQVCHFAARREGKPDIKPRPYHRTPEGSLYQARSEKATAELKFNKTVTDMLRNRAYYAYMRALKCGMATAFVSVEELIVRDGLNCYLCNTWMAVAEMTFDHVVPVSRGGPHTAENLKLAHRQCNNRKSYRLVEEIKDLGLWASGGTVEPLTCQRCSDPYTTRPSQRATSKYCSKKCSQVSKLAELHRRRNERRAKLCPPSARVVDCAA